MDVANFASLPDELVCEILSRSAPEDLFVFAHVDRRSFVLARRLLAAQQSRSNTYGSDDHADDFRFDRFALVCARKGNLHLLVPLIFSGHIAWRSIDPRSF